MTRYILMTVTTVAAAALIGGFLTPSSGIAGGSPPSAGSQGPSDPPPSATLNPDAFSQCDNLGELCLWRDGDYENTFWSFIPSSWDRWFYVGDNANDQSSSLYNNRSRCTYVNKDYPPSGQTIALPQQYAIEHLSNWSWPDGSNMNDSISSYNFLSTSSC